MKKFIFLILIFISFLLEGQIQVRPSNNSDFTPVDLVKNIFLGKGVKVIDIKYDGQNKSLGYFSNGESAISLDRGIIMTTGECTDASLPNSVSTISKGSSGSNLTDAELSNAIQSNELFDICRYEITFIPFFDSIAFNYVFASEEYPSFSCREYNDVFGFFISGLNPSGGNYNSENIALIPGTNEVVSINNVHPDYQDDCLAKNSVYYNANASGSKKMTYNGFIDVFTASAKVVPCTQYKIKIAIADVSDYLYDSAVFLEAKSFSSDGLNVEINTSSFDNTIAEGCSAAHVKFYFKYPQASDFDLEPRLISISGAGNQATPGIDYNSIPASMIVSKNSTSFEFDLIPTEDNLVENKEYFALEYLKEIYIKDNKLKNIELTDTIFTCAGKTTNIDAKLPPDIQIQNDQFFYNNEEKIISSIGGSFIYSSLNVNSIFPDILTREVLKEICIDNLHGRNLYDLDIYLVTPENVFLELSTDNGFRTIPIPAEDKMIKTCFTPKATIPINNGNPVLGDIFPTNPTYTGDFQPEGDWEDIYNTKANGIWKLFIQTDETGWEHTLESWHIAFNTDYSLTYQWTPATQISCTDCLSPNIFPLSDRYYYLKTTDTYGCSVKDSIFADIDELEEIFDLDCDSISTDFIRFSWTSANDDDIYEIKINDAPNWTEISENQLDLAGLSYSQTIKIEVRVKSGNCTNNTFMRQCETFPCPPPDIQLVSKKDLACFGDMNGEIKLSASGTTSPYTFRYKNTINSSGFFDNLPGGEDTIFVKDGDNCEIPYVFKIESPDALGADITFNEVSCNGYADGFILSYPYGGTGNYTFRWENSNNIQISTSKDVYNLDTGTYHFTILDSNHCISKKSIDIFQPDKIIVKDSIIDVSCKNYLDGKIFLDISGGTKPYNFEWTSNVGNAYTEDILNVPAGAYDLHIIDNNNCFFDSIYYITEPEEGLDYSLNAKDFVCYGANDGKIEIGIPADKNYIILWENGFYGNKRDNLSPGIYKITITDENGCEEILEQEIIEQEKIDVELQYKEPSCHDLEDGQLWVDKVFYGNRESAKSNFRYKWNTISDDTLIYLYNVIGGVNYTVTVTDENLCAGENSIFIENPEEIKIKLDQIRNVSCFRGNDGMIQIEVVNFPDCHYKWSHFENNIDTNTITDLKSGVYQVTVTNPAGCKEEKQFYITEPPPINISFFTKNVSCFGGKDGSVEAKIKGGTEPYFLLWSDSINSDKIYNVGVGKYFLEVIDLNGCSILDSIEIKQPNSPISLSTEVTDVTCFNGKDGMISISADGGNPPYSYKVQGGEFYGLNNIIGLSGGNYDVIVRDINYCFDTLKNITINQADPIILDIGSDTIIDFGEEIQIFPVLQNHIEPIIYKWIVPEGVYIDCESCQNPVIKPEYNTQVKLFITDFNGCSAEDTKYIRLKLANDIFVPTAFRPGSSNNDNNKLFVFGENGITVNYFKIFDKWGNMVYQRNNFEVNDQNEGWDGTFNSRPLNSGAYAWVLEIVHIDGTLEVIKGMSTLLK